MPSLARKALDKNLEDIDRLLDIHDNLGGPKQGRRIGLEVLNKSAIVLITSFWEAYCEDIAAESLKHLVTHAKSADALPKELRKRIAADLKRSQNDLEIWKIADGGWKTYLTTNLEQLKTERNRRVNTPKTAQIDELFLSATGFKQVSSYWRWKGMSVKGAQLKLGSL